MITTIDAAGRLVIPREVRREAALEPGTPLDVRWRDGVIEIEPQSIPVTIARRGRLMVAQSTADGPALDTDTVEQTRRSIATRPRRS